MTEHEWLTCRDPQAMLAAVRDWVTDRKARLFAAVCLQSLIGQGHDDRVNGAVRKLELCLEGTISTDLLGNSEITPSQRWSEDYPFVADPNPVAKYVYRATTQATHPHSANTLTEVPRLCLRAIQAATDPRDRANVLERETSRQVWLVHEMFGNPIRPVALNREWLTSDVLALARGIYDERAFERMPILADALQDAGCDNANILNHCRDASTTHVRGCWVVDLLLDKQ